MKHKVYIEKSRYGDKREFELCTDGIVITAHNSLFARVGWDFPSTSPDAPEFIDFDGGPFLSIGQELQMFECVYKIMGFENVSLKKESKYLIKVELVTEKEETSHGIIALLRNILHVN